MQNIIKKHWQYISILLGIFATLIVSAYNYGISFQKFIQLQDDINLIKLSSEVQSEKFNELNIKFEKLLTAAEIQNGIKIK